MKQNWLVFIASMAAVNSLYATELDMNLKQAETMLKSGNAVLLDQDKYEELLKQVEKTSKEDVPDKKVAESSNSNNVINIIDKKVDVGSGLPTKVDVGVNPKKMVTSQTSETINSPKKTVIEKRPSTLEELLISSIKNFKDINHENVKKEIIQFSLSYKDLDKEVIKSMEISKTNLEELLQVVKEIK